PTQITRLDGDPVRSLSIARSGDLAFSWGGGLYRLRAGAEEPERIEVNLMLTAFPGDSAARSSSFSDFVLSPTGREVALVAQGEIYVASMNGKYVKRI